METQDEDQLLEKRVVEQPKTAELAYIETRAIKLMYQ